MRRWALVLCFIGVMGGGCSARSLLTIELSTDDGTAVTGTPLIEVTQGDDVVRMVDRQDTIIILEEGSSASVGVYLDGDVSGAVKVTAALRVSDHCRWSGETRGNVRSGQRTTVEVKLGKGDCADSQPDGGTDAGDSGPTLLGDGGDAAPGTPTLEQCGAYCATYRQRCNGWGPDAIDCISRCTKWPHGTGAPDANENSLSCRQYYLRQAENNPDARNLCSVCPLASPDSEACGGPPAPPRGCQGDASADTD